jgi:hypothetical protein
MMAPGLVGFTAGGFATAACGGNPACGVAFGALAAGVTRGVIAGTYEHEPLDTALVEGEKEAVASVALDLYAHGLASRLFPHAKSAPGPTSKPKVVRTVRIKPHTKAWARVHGG